LPDPSGFPGDFVPPSFGIKNITTKELGEPGSQGSKIGDPCQGDPGYPRTEEPCKVKWHTLQASCSPFIMQTHQQAKMVLKRISIAHELHPA
jgi:hypothetical protein